AALDQLRLDLLLVVPTGQAWHKARRPSPAPERLAMARLAFGVLPRAVVDTREIDRDGPTYTWDTLRDIARERPGAQLVLIIGADQAAALPSWHRWRDIVSDTIVAVAERLSESGSAMSAASRFDPSTLPGLPPQARFERLEVPPSDASATAIRARCAAGLDVSKLVPPAVASYIDRHHLYRPT
ncbi:MAG: nicotinate (nicotinamide) nucleotide adenylyltransferase, partial [Comamonadaceae bacterium]